jgi:uncharacterized protein YfaS (alpha-2-macroglobulin family)
VWAVAAGVFLAAVSASSQIPALRVVSAGPTGELRQLADADDVRIVFSEPMIDLGVVPSGAAPSWMRLTPAVAGTFYWSGTRTLMFSPDANSPLPNATTFSVRVDSTAKSLAGRTLGTPYEFTFTTPTVRLLGVEWYRKDGRFDRPAVLRLRFNQRVRPEDVLAHTHVAMTPHEWTAPKMSDNARAWLQRTDPGGLERFDRKLDDVRRITQSTTPVAVKLAESWNEQQLWPVPNQVVLETTTAAPPDAWLSVTVDGDMPSPDGPARRAAQSSVVRLEPTLFGRPIRCTTACDPGASSGDAGFTQPVTTGVLRGALSITDVTDAAMERTIAPARELPADREKQAAWGGIRGYDAGFDPQPPARTWRYRVDPGLQALDGQTLGYPWVEIVENINAQPYLTYTSGVWESGGGTVIPLDAQNVESASVWTMPVSAADIMPRLRQLETDGRAPVPVPPVNAETRRFSVRPNIVESHGQDLRAFLSPQGTGIAWLATRPAELLAFTPLIQQNPTATRSSLVQVTNLGISVKDSPQSTLIFVTRLDTGAPVPDARVALIDRNNQSRWQGATDRDGVALAPSLTLRDPSRYYAMAFIATAEKDGDLSYVSSNWNGPGASSWNINYQIRDSRPLLRGSVFTDRGVYKEQEDVHFKAILRDEAATGLRTVSAGTEFDVRVMDARQREVDRRTVKVNRWGSGEWVWRVPVDAALGNYWIQIGRTGAFAANRRQTEVSGTFLVAAYRRPDFRVDLQLTADPPVLGATLQGTVEAKYLFGAALGARPARWWFQRQPAQAPPDAVRQRYPEAQYAIGYLPRSDEQGPPESSLPTKTEPLPADGRLAVRLPTAAEGDLAYTYRFEGDVEDVAGQHIANRSSLVVHPADLYVAVTRPPMFVESKNGLKLGVVATDLSGNAVRDVPVTVSLFRERWTYAPQSNYGFNWKREEVPAGEWVVRSSGTETPLTVPLRDGGCYVLRATARDTTGRKTRTDSTFYALGPGVSSWRAEGNKIDLTPERKTWKPGETARILVQSPWERATGLVTVEREGIRHHRAFTVTSTQDTVDVPITAADVPNVYVSVVLVKGRTATELTPEGLDAGQPAYRIGYTELTVDDASKRLQVQVSADKDEYRPRQPAQVAVSVRTPDGTPASSEVTFWAMDYGVLSLTGYSAPDVVKAIYANQALQVMTEDSRQALISRRRLVDRPLVPPPPPAAMPSPTPPILGFGARSSTVAGLPMSMLNVSATLSESVVAGLPLATRNAINYVSFLPGVQAEDIRTDFRSLVFWVGSATTDASGRATTTVTLPDSLTSYRIIAVAGDDRSRFGVGEREIRVTKPLTLLPQFPRFLSTGDRASFGAVVTNAGTEPGQALVRIQSLDPNTLQFGTSTTRTLQLAPGASESLTFDALARASGSARVRVAVTMGADVDAFEMPLTVTAPMQLETTAAYGDTVATAIERLALPPGISRTAGGLNVELASTALVGLGESARYLTEYPFECAEQKASRALALLLASDLDGAFKLSDIAPDQYRAEGIRALRSLYGYQCGNGGFALWPESCETSSAYLTAYVLHVMKVGETLKVPFESEAVRRALDYLQGQLRQAPPEIHWRAAWGAAQAFSVKVLAEYGRQPTADLARLSNEADRLPVFALSYLADALSVTGGPASRDRYNDVVRRITNALRIEADRVHVEEVDEDALAWLWNTNTRATAVVLDGLARRRDEATFVPGLARWLVASRANGRWRTTHENAMALEALVSYYRAFESETPAMTTTVKIGAATVGTARFNGRSMTAQEVRLSMADLLRHLGGGTPALTINREGTGRAYYTARVQYFAPQRPEPVDRGFRVDRRYERYVPDGTGPPATSFAAGDLIRVTVTLTLRGEGRYLALTDPLPAAFEPLEGWFQTTASDLGRQATRVNQGNDWLSMWRRGTFDHVEKHDDRVVGVATRLGSGRHEFSYLVRATTAGTFTAAGARVEAMYAPELSGRSGATTVVVR